MAKKINKKSNENLLYSLLAIILLALVGLFVFRQESHAPTPADVNANKQKFDLGNKTIDLDGRVLQLKNGAYENKFENEAAILMNESSSPSGNQAAAILIDSPGGSGTFYYLIGALLDEGKVKYSSPMPLGDRIKIVNVSVDDPEKNTNGLIIVRFMGRAENAPMAETPNIEYIQKYGFDADGNLTEVNR